MQHMKHFIVTFTTSGRLRWVTWSCRFWWQAGQGHRCVLCRSVFSWCRCLRIFFIVILRVCIRIGALFLFGFTRCLWLRVHFFLSFNLLSGCRSFRKRLRFKISCIWLIIFSRSGIRGLRLLRLFFSFFCTGFRRRLRLTGTFIGVWFRFGCSLFWKGKRIINQEVIIERSKSEVITFSRGLIFLCLSCRGLIRKRQLIGRDVVGWWLQGLESRTGTTQQRLSSSRNRITAVGCFHSKSNKNILPF